jgi:hypothetical protein
MITSLSPPKPIGTRAPTSSMMPRTPTTGVGWMAAGPVEL